MQDGTGIFVGIGVGHGSTSGSLDPAVLAVAEISRLLRPAFVGEPIVGPSGRRIREHLVSSGSGERAPTFVMWSGHGRIDDHGLWLSVADGVHHAGEFVRACAELRSGQLLVVVDIRTSEVVEHKADDVVSSLFDHLPGYLTSDWLGIIVSCRSADSATDGGLGTVLRRLLVTGPQEVDVRRRWIGRGQSISGADLADAVIREWVGDLREVAFVGRGDPRPMIPNPLWTDDSGADAADDADQRLVLAGALLAQGIHQAAEGALDNALAPTAEAVDLYRAVPAQAANSASNMAIALRILVACLASAGRWEEASASAAELVELTRGLVASRERTRSDVVAALSTYSVVCDRAGRDADAVRSLEDVVTLYRQPLRDRAADLPNLAEALSALAIRYGKLGRRSDAAAAARESVEVYRHVGAGGDHSEYRQAFGAALRTLVSTALRVGRPREAFEAGLELILAHPEQLFRTRPGRN